MKHRGVQTLVLLDSLRFIVSDTPGSWFLATKNSRLVTHIFQQHHIAFIKRGFYSLYGIIASLKNKKTASNIPNATLTTVVGGFPECKAPEYQLLAKEVSQVIHPYVAFQACSYLSDLGFLKTRYFNHMTSSILRDR